jgi:hypothetical protein
MTLLEKKYPNTGRSPEVIAEMLRQREEGGRRFIDDAWWNQKVFAIAAGVAIITGLAGTLAGVVAIKGLLELTAILGLVYVGAMYAAREVHWRRHNIRTFKP